MPTGIFYPTTWTLKDIKPQLHVYRQQRDVLKIPHDVSAESAAALLSENDYLTSSRLIFIVHGFRNTIDTEWLLTMKDAMIKESDQTVILVGWGNGANLLPIEYLQAGANIQAVGDWLGPHAAQISSRNPDLIIWGVAHSLGAHLLGIAGRNSGVFTRITGLDPAGPAFEHDGEFAKYRLKSNDAKEIVDIIHTDGYDSYLDPSDWISAVNHYGTLVPWGTIDFYPNYGYCQPGSGHFTIAGSHTRAIDLFIWSIANPDKFFTNIVLDGVPSFESPVKTVKQVHTGVEMGYHYSSTSKIYKSDEKPLFYVETNKTEPWVGSQVIPVNSCVIC